MQTRGLDPLLTVYGGRSLDEALGVSIDELVEAYEAEAPWGYPSATGCTAPRVEFGPGADLAHELHSSCDGDGHRMIRSLSGFVQTKRTLDVPVGGAYALRLEGGYGMDIGRCLPEGALEDPETDKSGDVYTEAALGKIDTFFFSELDHVVELEAGPHEVVFYSTPGVDEETLRVHLALVSE